MLTFIFFSLVHWDHNCPIVLSSPRVCVKHNRIFVKNENGQLEKWLILDDDIQLRYQLSTYVKRYTLGIDSISTIIVHGFVINMS